MEILPLRTRSRTEFADITEAVRARVRASGVAQGTCTVCVPHTTAGVTINEHADPDVMADIGRSLDVLVPWQAGYAHAEGNAAAHIKASLMGSSVTVIIEGGDLRLGTWQGIFFAEFDGPRTREAWVTVTER